MLKKLLTAIALSAIFVGAFSAMRAHAQEADSYDVGGYDFEFKVADFGDYFLPDAFEPVPAAEAYDKGDVYDPDK
jgi:hypothetical protein